MDVRKLHSWRVSPVQARQIQERLQKEILRQAPRGFPRLVAGADVSYDKRGTDLYAAVVVLDINTLRTVEVVGMKARATFPYIPGLLSFREVPPLIRIFRRLRARPEALVCDGQGVAHPRRFGLACHLGLLLDLPSLGCAKTRLIGNYREPGRERGQFSPLQEGEEVIGSVLRTRTDVQPVFVSVGHRISLEIAREIVLRLTPHFRLPETTRQAHHRVNDLRRADMRSRGADEAVSLV